MNCIHCKEHYPLVRIKNPHSFDYDYDGLQFFFFLQCLTVETRTSRDDLFRKQDDIENSKQFSNRMRKRILFQLCNQYKNFNSDEQRKVFIKDTMNNLRKSSDKECVKHLSSIFGLKSNKILDLFYHQILKQEYGTFSFMK